MKGCQGHDFHLREVAISHGEPRGRRRPRRAVYKGLASFPGFLEGIPIQFRVFVHSPVPFTDGPVVLRMALTGQMGRMSRIHVVGCEPSSKLRPVADHYLRHRTRLFRGQLVVQHTKTQAIDFSCEFICHKDASPPRGRNANVFCHRRVEFLIGAVPSSTCLSPWGAQT